MRSRCIKYFLVGMGVLIFLAVGSNQIASAMIQPYPSNPYYWQYNNLPIILIGGSGHDSIFQWDSPDLLTHLDTLSSVGGNYIRNTLNSRSWDTESSSYRYDQYLRPFHEVTPGIYDLDQWNDAYWNKLVKFLDATRDRGIIVQLEIWDAAATIENTAWSFSAWNPDNNINYSYTDTQLISGSTSTFVRNFYEAVPALNNDLLLLAYQRQFIDKVLSITAAYDHILYQIDNESPLPHEVGKYWAKYIQDHTSQTVYVADERRYHPPSYAQTDFQDISHPENFEPIQNPVIFNYLDIAQNSGNTGQTHYDNLIWYRSQVGQVAARPINCVKTYHFNWPTGLEWNSRSAGTDSEAGAKFWRTIFGGGASVRFHRDTPRAPLPGLGLSLLAQVHLQSMRMMLDQATVYDMAPRNDLLSDREKNEAYTLAAEGDQYAVYFTGDGNRSVTLAVETGEYMLRWLDILDSTWLPMDTFAIEGSITLNAPDDGQWVSLLVKLPPTVATPTFTPDGGEIYDIDPIVLATETDDAIIHFTIDGTDPSTTSPIYAGPLTLADDATVKAMAVKSGMNDSLIASATFIVTQTVVAAPAISPNGGTISDHDEITITTSTTGATIYYTTDGSDPTTASPVYAEPLTLADDATVKAMAVKSGMNDSQIASASFSILQPVAPPTFTPDGGEIYDIDPIVLATETDDAIIHFTIDGTDPSTTSPHLRRTPYPRRRCHHQSHGRQVRDERQPDRIRYLHRHPDCCGGTGYFAKWRHNQ